jgi:hypothetical protein
MAACGDCCQTVVGAGGCGEGCHGSQNIEGAADGAPPWVRVGVPHWVRVGVVGGVVGLPCACYDDSRS